MCAPWRSGIASWAAALIALGGCEAGDDPALPPHPPTLAETATDLPYERTGEEDLTVFPETSGLAWHPSRQTLFVVGDEGHVGEFRPDGTAVQGRHVLYEDFEGITVVPATGLLYVAIEGRDNVLEIDPEGLRVLREFDLPRESEGVEIYDKSGEGIEGIAFVPDPKNAEGGTFLVVNRAAHDSDPGDPPLLFEVELPLSSTSTDRLEGVMRSYKKLDVLYLSGLEYQAAGDRLFAVSDDDALLVELTRAGDVVSAHELPVEGPEAIAFDSDGFLYVGSDGGGVVKLAPREASPTP
jgi:uncharacterized protein YjiK